MVISGTLAGMEAATRIASGEGMRRAVKLNVSGAFHSPLMDEAAVAFAVELDRATVADPSVPVACNVDGAAGHDAASLRDRLRRQLTAAVRWTDCVQTLIALGADTLIEIGPGNVLTGLARRIAPDVRAVSAVSLDAVRALIATAAT